MLRLQLGAGTRANSHRIGLSMLIRHCTEMQRSASGAFFMPIPHPSLPQAEASKQAATHPKRLGRKRKMKKKPHLLRLIFCAMDALRIAQDPR